MQGEAPTSEPCTHRPGISRPTRRVFGSAAAEEAGMVELSWYRVEVEMERGRKKKQGWVGMRGGDRAGQPRIAPAFGRL